MQLWTEYEGRKIAGAYTLGKLLRSEGRNGFFATADTTGKAAVIRLTEPHYDEDELLKRWRQVADMRQANLIGIEHFGQTDFDGVAITYALMEANDANLGDVLHERPLTLTETTQVARAVHGALTALHASGLVHEHIEPVNVLAVGETVKLRSDCVRECIADIEFNTPEGCAELRRRDVHDFGMLLLECLTLEKRYNPGLNLPDIFRRMIPHMLDGTWSLEQVGQLVNPPAAAPAPSTVAARSQAAIPKTQSELVKAKSAKPNQPEQGTLPLDVPRAGGEPAADPALRYRREVADESGAFQSAVRGFWAALLQSLCASSSSGTSSRRSQRSPSKPRHRCSRLRQFRPQLRGRRLSPPYSRLPNLLRTGRLRPRRTLRAGTLSRGPTTIRRRRRRRQITSTLAITASMPRSSVRTAALRISSASAAP